MKRTLLVLIVASAFAAACKERKSDKVEARPDYDGSHRASERAHESLDKEAGGN